MVRHPSVPSHMDLLNSTIPFLEDGMKRTVHVRKYTRIRFGSKEHVRNHFRRPPVR
jgi:hypothetical protein